MSLTNEAERDQYMMTIEHNLNLRQQVNITRHISVATKLYFLNNTAKTNSKSTTSLLSFPTQTSHTLVPKSDMLHNVIATLYLMVSFIFILEMKSFSIACNPDILTELLGRNTIIVKVLA